MKRLLCFLETFAMFCVGMNIVSNLPSAISCFILGVACWLIREELYE